MVSTRIASQVTQEEVLSGLLFLLDKDRFLVFREGQEIDSDGRKVPAIAQTVYGGHKTEVMTQELQISFGQVNPELLMKELIPKICDEIEF